MNETKVYAKFLAKNGHDFERKKAVQVFDTDKEYEIVGGWIGDWCSYLKFKDIPESWNSVMFDYDESQANSILEHSYSDQYIQ